MLRDLHMLLGSYWEVEEHMFKRDLPLLTVFIIFSRKVIDLVIQNMCYMSHMCDLEVEHHVLLKDQAASL